MRPVHLIVNDDQIRSPLTVVFRLILVIPHLIWVSLWGLAAFVVVIINWFATLFVGQSPRDLHNFLAHLHPLRDSRRRLSVPPRRALS